MAGKQHGATVWSQQTGKVLHSLDLSTLLNSIQKQEQESDDIPYGLNHSFQSVCNAEVTRCTSDRYSSVVGTLTSVGIGLWGY